MKYISILLFLLLTSTLEAQDWVSDKDFEEKVTGRSAFDDDEEQVVIVEFWAEFNKDNAFPDWKKLDSLDGVKYYRCDIATSPKLKKELRIIENKEKLEIAKKKAEEARKKIFKNYTIDGKKNWDKNKSYFKESYITQDMLICSKLVGEK